MSVRTRTRTKLVGTLAVVGLLAAPASVRASEGANEVAPIAEDVAPIVSRGLGSLSGYYLAARHAGFTKDLSSAAGFYRQALTKDPENPELLDRSVLMNVASGNIQQAAQLAEELLERDPADQVALIALAVAHLRAGENEAALEAIDRLGALEGQLQRLMAGLMRAWVTAADGNAAQAVAALDALEGPSWFTTFTTLHAGLIADQAELHEIARDRLQLSHENDQASVRVVDAYARQLARSGEPERAEAVLAAFEERIGGSEEYTTALRSEIASGDVAPQVETPRAGFAEALYGIGSAVGTEGGDTLAASLLQLSLYLTPDGYYPAMALGQVLEAMGQHEAAIEVYRAIPPGAGPMRSARMQEALNLNVLERHDEAIALLVDLVADNPNDTAIAVSLGNVYRSRERFADARDVYTAAIDALGEVPEAYWSLYYYRGITHERTDNWDAAEADFRKALELRPEQPLVLNYLGYSLIDQGQKLDEAVDMVQRAVEQRPDDGYIVDSLGWAYYRLGRYEDAVRELERAVSLKPADPVINDHLGDAYWKVGRRLEAMFQWTHARDSDPEPDDLKKILAKLEYGLGEDGEPARTLAETEETEEAEAPEASVAAGEEPSPEDAARVGTEETAVEEAPAPPGDDERSQQN